MGLDMYAYAAAKPNMDWNSNNQRELAYWRKHPNLHGWMEQLWHSRNTDPTTDPMFNGVELELTWEDIDQLEHDIQNNLLPSTSGFFFGDDSDNYYKQQDLDFVKQARAELFSGLKVFYNSSW
jgi:hypothetical protein